MPIHNPCQISKIGLFEVELNGLRVDDRRPVTVGILDISPIPLTEEILLKCGLEYQRPDFIKGSFAIRDFDGGYIYLNGLDGGLIYEYLHQLQNLYFALTGEELEVKL